MEQVLKETGKRIFFRLCVPILVAFGVWFVVQSRYQFRSPFSVLLNIAGTFLLAFAISFPEGPNRLRWWLFESMNFGGTPSFSYPNFYLGLAALTVGIIIGSL
jgi:dolichyl-phosphate-mannose--protein O-mannosyl transferase